MISTNPSNNVKRFIIDLDGVPMSQALTLVAPDVFCAETDKLMRRNYRHVFWTELYFTDAVLLISGHLPITPDDEADCRQLVEDYLDRAKHVQSAAYQRARYAKMRHSHDH